MAAATGNPYLRGVRDATPFLFVIVPFATLFGVVATEAGLTVAETMGFSVLVIAGASQFAAIALMSEDAPTLIVLATALAVNLRMAMYSAALVPHLGAAPLWRRALASYLLVDQSYAASILEYERRPEMTLSQKLAYFWGVVTPVFPTWYAFTLVGAVMGGRIPEAAALDFAVPITFLAIVGPMLKTVAHLAAAVTSVALALALSWLPAGVGLLLAAGAAMCVGATVEIWQGREAP
jgi:predicted branched-subunit amino acid permease